jgi:hypothetical protein
MSKIVSLLGKKVRLKFAGKLNKVKDNRTIWIPKSELDKLKEFDEKQVIFTIDIEELKD